MSINQLFFSLSGLMVTLAVAGVGFLKYYIDAKIDPLYKIMDKLDARDASLNAYVIDHAERISRMEPKRQ